MRDWNVSRQIAWGIPIPAFQNVDDSDDWIFDTRVDQEIIEIDGKTYRRDPDVFDTWFSSGQWPFVTLGYPDSEDFKDFYPNAVMETGQDILYQWVARMICLGVYVTGDIPFKDVYLHGMVRAEDGRKMSKSLGNVVDPTPILEEFGSDALRMGMISGRSAGYSSAYAPSKIQAGRNFANKLWNIARFIEDKLGDDFAAKSSPKPVSAADHWIIDKLNAASKLIGEHMDNYRFSEAFDAVYHCVWDDFADWYIEASKDTPNTGVLAYSLETVLKLAHPFAPFVTETIWQTLAWESDSVLASSSWPKQIKAEDNKVAEFEQIRIIVTEARDVISSLQLRKPTLYYTGVDFLQDNAALISRLARLKGVKDVTAGHGLHLTGTQYPCWLDVDRETAQRYLHKLQDKQKTSNEEVKRLRARMDNDSYVKNAPKQLVDQTKDQLKEAVLLLSNVTQEIDHFSKASKEL